MAQTIFSSRSFGNFCMTYSFAAKHESLDPQQWRDPKKWKLIMITFVHYKVNFYFKVLLYNAPIYNQIGFFYFDKAPLSNLQSLTCKATILIRLTRAVHSDLNIVEYFPTSLPFFHMIGNLSFVKRFARFRFYIFPY